MIEDVEMIDDERRCLSGMTTSSIKEWLDHSLSFFLLTCFVSLILTLIIGVLVGKITGMRGASFAVMLSIILVVTWLIVNQYYYIDCTGGKKAIRSRNNTVKDELKKGTVKRLSLECTHYLEIKEYEDEGRKIIIKLDDKTGFHVIGQEFYEYDEDEGDVETAESSRFPRERTTIRYCPELEFIFNYSSDGNPAYKLAEMEDYKDIGLTEVPRNCEVVEVNWDDLTS